MAEIKTPNSELFDSATQEKTALENYESKHGKYDPDAVPAPSDSPLPTDKSPFDKLSKG